MISTESIDLDEKTHLGGTELSKSDERGALTFREFVVYTRSGVSTKVPFVVARIVRGGKTSDLDDDGEKTVISLRKLLSDFKKPEWERGSRFPPLVV